MDIMNTLLEVLLGIVIFVALFGVIVTQANGFDWSNVTVGGDTLDLGFVPYLIVLIIAIGFLVLVYKSVYKKGK